MARTYNNGTVRKKVNKYTYRPAEKKPQVKKLEEPEKKKKSKDK